MLSDIYYRKRIGFPYLSFVFLICCLIVSIPTCFEPRLYYVFGNSKNPEYIWQIIIPIFEHGQIQGELYHLPGYDPLMLHLTGNILMLLAFGVLSERIIGPRRFLLLSLSAITADCILRLLFNMGGNGASGVIYAYPPVSILIILQLYKTGGKELFKDWLLYIFIAGFIMGWIVVTAVYGSRGNLGANIVHICASIIGVVFSFIWRKAIYTRIYETLQGKKDSVQLCGSKIIYAAVSVIPLFLAVIVMLALGGVITT